MYMLTTTDNKFDPVTDFDRWYDEDRRLGYDTCSLIARLTSSTSDSMTDEEVESEIDTEIDNIIEAFAGVRPYKKIKIKN